MSIVLKIIIFYNENKTFHRILNFYRGKTNKKDRMPFLDIRKTTTEIENRQKICHYLNETRKNIIT